ncbi:hypothetical protein AVEN_221494-1 [Araneus ventricosus]|uniref:Uncharacterized protein n=1 Tax=Araneus ventricosus TaxID=182803 RepID=A0A4Y2DZU9_ARAVE|nr:hypothetical protein AVEN_221494-1 [Araneus ventricosus]
MLRPRLETTRRLFWDRPRNSEPWQQQRSSPSRPARATIDPTRLYLSFSGHYWQNLGTRTDEQTKQVNGSPPRPPTTTTTRM